MNIPLRSQLCVGSKPDCLSEQFNRIYGIQIEKQEVKGEKSGGIAGREGRCGGDVAWLLELKLWYVHVRKPITI